ncbi:hypothetical protein K439DRAFT_1289837, partial [Ramaria rubella]
YDIACKYNVHLHQCLLQRFPHISDLAVSMKFAIGGMYIEAHELWCKKLFKQDFWLNTSKCDGEGSECVWAELNQWGPSTSEMTPAHRHDVMMTTL